MASHAAAPAATPAPAPVVPQNPEWIRGILVSFALAIALRAGFGIPVMTGLMAIMIIFLSQVLLTDLKVGFQASLKGLKFTTNLIGGVVIFLAIRFLLSGVIGIYPIDSRDLLWSRGGLEGLAWSRDISIILLWEMVFAFVTGKLVANWVNDKDHGMVKLVFATAFSVLTLQLALPTYAKSFPSRDQVGQKLVDRGILGGAWDGLKVVAFGKSATPTPSATQPSAAYAPTEPTLVLRRECITPCSADIQWPVQIWGDGPEFLVRFKGIQNPVRYGRGKHSAPEGVNVGETFFEAADPAQPVVIRVYQVVRN